MYNTLGRTTAVMKYILSQISHYSKYTLLILHINYNFLQPNMVITNKMAFQNIQPYHNNDSFK